MSDEDLARKTEVFKARKGTTHWPVKATPFWCKIGMVADGIFSQQQLNVVPADRAGYHYAVPRRPNDTPDAANRTRPFTEPEETETVLRLVGLRA